MTGAAERVLDSLRARGQTLATAESLTAGLVSSTLAAVPGASDVLRGGLVAYATEVKSSVLGVDAALIEEHGVVSSACAGAMAERARVLFEADWAAATTGVAGPTEQDGRPVGLVFVAVAGPGGGAHTEAHRFSGGRNAVREAAVDAVLGLLAAVAAEPEEPRR